MCSSKKTFIAHRLIFWGMEMKVFTSSMEWTQAKMRKRMKWVPSSVIGEVA